MGDCQACEMQRMFNTPCGPAVWCAVIFGCLRVVVVVVVGSSCHEPVRENADENTLWLSDNMSLCIRTGFYRQEINKTVWDVPERYRDLIQVGTGAYGTVW